MNDDIQYIQQTLIYNIQKLDKENANVKIEVARSRAISQLANTYLKSCNLKLKLKNEKK